MQTPFGEYIVGVKAASDLFAHVRILYTDAQLQNLTRIVCNVNLKTNTYSRRCKCKNMRRTWWFESPDQEEGTNQANLPRSQCLTHSSTR